MVLNVNLKEEFKKRFNTDENLLKAFCPYRLCPIGAHVDHQFGLVSGFAINEGIEIMFVPDKSKVIELESLNMEGRVSFPINDVPDMQNDWADYLRGGTKYLAQDKNLKIGLKGLIYGSMPIGGLSSSAAVIICFLKALAMVNEIELTEQEYINFALKAEKDYVGVNVGKLDQSCEVLCKKDNLLFLDTKDDTYKYIPNNPNMKPFEFAVIFSGVQRTLVGSSFNMRVDECKSASYLIKALSGIPYGKYADSRLRDVPYETFLQYKDKIPNDWAKRATHFYTECERVKKGAECWEKGDIECYGKLVFESGYSSIYNFETGSDELKEIYNIMTQTKGIYGGRFSGAGFKGCCMAIVNPEYKEHIKEEITRRYLEKFPQYKDTFGVYFCKSENGVGIK